MAPPMTVAVIANGAWDSDWGRSALNKDQIELLIAADGGGNHAISSGRIPDVLIGDLDSILPANLQICQQHQSKIVSSPPEKDQTDLELALAYAEEYLASHAEMRREILFFGAGGKRLDHLLGNIGLLLAGASKGIRIKMIDKEQEAWVLLPGTEYIQGAVGQTISLLALSDQVKISTTGLYYECYDLLLSQNSPRGVSNVFRQDQIQIQVSEGSLLVVLLNRENRL